MREEVTLPPLAAAPMHRLLLAQMRIAFEREAAVGDAAAGILGPEAARALARARRDHPAVLPDAAASGGDAYDVLQRTIAALLARESAGHRALRQACGDSAEVRLRLCAFDHGARVGRSAGGATGVQAVFDALASLVLEDMPCRTRVELVSETRHEVRWAHHACPYRAAWDRANADAALSCQVMSAWIRGVAAGLDPTVEYRRPQALALGDASCSHALVVIG